MSKPTPRDELYAWHKQALEDRNNLLYIEANPDEPQCGYFETRLVKGGPFVAARIWMYQPVDEESGDLIGDENLQCEVDGKYRDPAQAWSWLYNLPIDEARFKFLTDLRAWAEKNAPNEPFANPKKPVDWLNGVPTPTFTNQGAKT